MSETTYRNIIPASKTERLQPKFLRKDFANGTPGNIVAEGPRGLPVRATSKAGTVKGAVYPDEGGRRGRIGLPGERFRKA